MMSVMTEARDFFLPIWSDFIHVVAMITGSLFECILFINKAPNNPVSPFLEKIKTAGLGLSQR